MIAARRSQCHIQRVSDIFGTSITAQLPCGGIAREVIEYLGLDDHSSDIVCGQRGIGSGSQQRYLHRICSI